MQMLKRKGVKIAIGVLLAIVILLMLFLGIIVSLIGLPPSLDVKLWSRKFLKSTPPANTQIIATNCVALQQGGNNDAFDYYAYILLATDQESDAIKSYYEKIVEDEYGFITHGEGVQRGVAVWNFDEYQRGDLWIPNGKDGKWLLQQKEEIRVEDYAPKTVSYTHLDVYKRQK